MLIRLGEHQPQRAEQGCWIAPNAAVIGRVTLAEESSVWFGAVIRADSEPIEIGPRTNIQDLSVLHTDPGFPLTIGADCTIGHHAMLHGCTIGQGSLIGIGAIVMNGVKIGNNCLIGAGALIPEGTEIADRSLVVGLPGRVLRKLTDEDVARLMKNAAVYVARAQEYAASAVIVTETAPQA